MKVLGVLPSSTGVVLAVVDGTFVKPELGSINLTKIKFPKDQDEQVALSNLNGLSKALVAENEIEKICILQAGYSQHGSPSSLRIKAEAVFQLIGDQSNIPVQLVAPQTLRANEKKFPGVTGDTPENILNAGNEFKPKPVKDAVLTSWIGLKK